MSQGNQKRPPDQESLAKRIVEYNERQVILHGVCVAWSSVSLICSLFLHKLIPIFILFTWKAKSISQHIPLVLGLRGFGNDDLEGALDQFVYPLANRIGKIVVLFDQKDYTESSKIKRMHAPTYPIKLSWIVACAILGILVWKYAVIPTLWQTILIEIGICLGSWLIIQYWVANLVHRITVFVLPLLAFYLLGIYLSLIYAMIAAFVLYYLLDKIWIISEHITSPVIDDEQDLEHLKRELNGNTCHVRSFLGIGGAMRINLFCSDSIWEQVVELLMKKVDYIIIDISRPGNSLIWELNKAIELKKPMVVTCHSDCFESSVASLSGMINKEDVCVYPESE